MSYTFSEGEPIAGTREATEQKQKELQQLLDNYLDLYGELDTDAYVARGNGFCDAKYSDAFIESQIAKIEEKLSECKKILSLQQ